MILVEDWKFHICLFLDKNSPRNNIIIMSDDHLVKKEVLLDYQNMDFIQPSYRISFKGVNPCFRSKNGILL